MSTGGGSNEYSTYDFTVIGSAYSSLAIKGLGKSSPMGDLYDSDTDSDSLRRGTVSWLDFGEGGGTYVTRRRGMIFAGNLLG